MCPPHLSQQRCDNLLLRITAQPVPNLRAPAHAREKTPPSSRCCSPRSTRGSYAVDCTDSSRVPLTSNSHAKADALVLHTRSTPSVILSCAKAGLRVAIFAVPISNRALQVCTTEPRFSVERELHPTLTSQEYKPMISNSSAPGSKPALTNLELAEPRGFSFLRHCSLTLTAVLVDAAFFLKRAARIYGHQTPEAAAKQLHRIALDTRVQGSDQSTRPDFRRLGLCARCKISAPRGDRFRARPHVVCDPARSSRTHRWP